MRLPFPELLLTALLGGGFVAVGELVLRRRSHGFGDANEAMLAGMGVCAAALFPLTLALRQHALAAEALLIGGCLAWAVGVRLARPGPPRAARSAPRDLETTVVVALVALVSAGFAALNFRYQYLWDGFLIWASKAQLLFHSGGLTREWFREDLYDLRHLAYPPLVPLWESLLAFLRGGFDFDRFKPVFLLFYLSLLVGSYAAARSVASARRAAVATLLVCLVPALSTHYAAGAYADMPQAAVVAGAVAAAMAGRRDSAPWLLGALTTVKAEGTILAAVACGGIGLFWLLESPRALPRRLAREAPGIAIVATFFALRFAYVRWIAAPEVVYSGSLAAALGRLPETIWLCLLQLLDPSKWGLFWPAFLACAFVLRARGSSREKALAAATLAGLFLAIVPFLFTSWPLALQIEQAYFRLAAQLAPAAAVAMVLADARLAASRESRG